TQAHGSRGEIDRVGVFGATRIGLQAAELAKFAKLRRVQVAEQVLHGVKGRAGVRLDADAVAGAQPSAKVQRSQDRDNGRAARLVTTDFHAVRAGSHVVGLVHHARGQPQDALLN